MPTEPIDPLESPKYVLDGRVVTMNPTRKVIDKGRIYIDAGQIHAVQPAAAPPPAEFQQAPVVKTGDTIFPGMIELHNHLSYNAIPMWIVPKLYGNRGQWGRHPDYRKTISGPASVLGRTAGYIEAMVRYVEAKCLLGGVTTSQGISLSSNMGIRRYYKGIVRNVEQTKDPDLPEVRTRISDVRARDAQKFLDTLNRSSALLLHLSEGLDDSANRHFQALKISSHKWAITEALAGIHCTGLRDADYAKLAQKGGSMIWSPFSNYLLYGGTADIQRAKQEGLLMGIGSDWSPSGSKNLLGELKVARITSNLHGDAFSNQELVAMATCNPAKIIKWDQQLGSIEVGKRADFTVVNGRQGDPYEQFVDARETSITLVVINGIARYGQPRLMEKFATVTEELQVGESNRMLNLSQESSDPLVGALTLQEAQDRLRAGMAQLPQLAQQLENPDTASLVMGAAVPGEAGSWFLELDHDHVPGFASRPMLRFGNEQTGNFLPAWGAEPLSQILAPLELDGLTVADDRGFFRRVAAQRNLPDVIKEELARAYAANLPQVSTVVGLREVESDQPARATSLREFASLTGNMSLSDRQLVLEQALVLLEQAYVHLPMKRAMHASDPIQRLRLLQFRLSQQSDARMDPELEFHREVGSIFQSVHDLHTNYLLPSPFREHTAFLPFLVEEYYDREEQSHYLLSKVADGFEHPTFVPGVEILYWNGTPIRKAIQAIAALESGSNPTAQFARGLSTLTIRPMVRVLPPDEEWVNVTFRDSNGNSHEIRQQWKVWAPGTSIGVDPDSGTDFKARASLGFDLETDAVNQAKKELYAPQAAAAEKKVQRRRIPFQSSDAVLPTHMPTVFRANTFQTRKTEYGYIRIFSFNVPHADRFLDEFLRLLEQLPEEGLILDVRGNGGGLIHAAEQLLQIFTPHEVHPEPAQFVTTPLMLRVCRNHAPSNLDRSFNLEPWVASIRHAVSTGSTYSTGHPITSDKAANDRGQHYYGGVVLITDALCYSATDMFAAGFKDHRIGKILGVHDNTGAGGANVWSHALLRQLLENSSEEENPLKPLPHNAGMRVAARRTIRVGEQSGMPVEDLGVQPDEIHRMTVKDLLQGNKDLLKHAAKILARLPKYALQAEVLSDSLRGRARKRTLQMGIRAQNIDRVDLRIHQKPAGSYAISDRVLKVTLEEVPRSAVVEITGVKKTKIVARKRFKT